MREHGCLDLEALNTEVLRQNWFRSNERDAEQLQTPSPSEFHNLLHESMTKRLSLFFFPSFLLAFLY